MDIEEEEDDNSYVPDSLKEFLQAADRQLDEDLADLLSPFNGSGTKEPQQQLLKQQHRRIVSDPSKGGDNFQYGEDDIIMDDTDVGFHNVVANKEADSDLLKRSLMEGWLDPYQEQQQPQKQQQLGGDRPGDSVDHEEDNNADGNNNNNSNSNNSSTLNSTDHHEKGDLMDILHPLADVTASHLKRVAMESDTDENQNHSGDRTDTVVGDGTVDNNMDNNMLSTPSSNMVGRRKLENELDQESERSILDGNNSVVTDKAIKSPPSSNVIGGQLPKQQNQKVVAPSPAVSTPEPPSSTSRRNVQSRPEPTPSDERDSPAPIISPPSISIRNVQSRPEPTPSDERGSPTAPILSPPSTSIRNVQSRPEPTPSDEQDSIAQILSTPSKAINISSPPPLSATRNVQSRREPTPTDERDSSSRRSLPGKEQEVAARIEGDTSLSSRNDNKSIPQHRHEEQVLTNQGAIAVRRPIPPDDEVDSDRFRVSTEQHSNVLNRLPETSSLVMQSPLSTEQHPKALLKLPVLPAATTNSTNSPQPTSNTSRSRLPRKERLPSYEAEKKIANDKVDEPSPRIGTRPATAAAYSARPSPSRQKQTSKKRPTGVGASSSPPPTSNNPFKTQPTRPSPPKPTEIVIPPNKTSVGSRRNSKGGNAVGGGRMSSASSSSSSSTVSPLPGERATKAGNDQTTKAVAGQLLMASSTPLFGRKDANAERTALSPTAPSPLNPRVLMNTVPGIKSTGTGIKKSTSQRPAPEQARPRWGSRNRIQQQQQQTVSGRRPLTRPDKNISRLLKPTSASRGHAIVTNMSSTSISGATSMSSSVQQSVSLRSLSSNSRLLRPTRAGRRTDGTMSIASSVQSSISGSHQTDDVRKKEEERQTKERVRARIERQKKIKEERDKEHQAMVATVEELDKRRKEKIGAAIQRTRDSRQRLERMEQERLAKLKARITSKDERSQKGETQTLEDIPSQTEQLLQEKENHRPALQRRSIAISSRKPPPTIPVSPKFATDLRLHSKDPAASRRTACEESPPLAASGDILMQNLRAPPPKTTTDASTSRGKRPLTIPEAPKFATTLRYGDKQPPTSPQKRETPDDVSWLFTLRDGNVSPISKAASSVRTGPLTIPQTPQFQPIRKRPLPKSTAEKEKEEMEYYKNHPFRARAVKLYPPPPASLSAKGPSGKPRPLTTPEPFHFRIEERIGRGHGPAKDELDEDDGIGKFKAKPMPNFSSNRTPTLSQVTTNKKLTTPEPFHFHTSRRAASDAADVAGNGVEGNGRRSNRPTGSSGLFFRRASAGWTPSSGRLSAPNGAKQPAEETKPFKAKPMPIFVPRSIEVRSESTSPLSDKLLTSAEKRQRAILSDDAEPFKARPMPQFDKVRIHVKSRDPSKIRSTPSKDEEADIVPVFHARPIPKSLTKDPAIPVKQRDPTKLRSPDSVSKSEDSPPHSKISPNFRARPVPQAVLGEPSIPVRPKESSTSRPRESPRRVQSSIDPPKNERPTSFHARSIPPSLLEEPAIPVKPRDPSKLRSPEYAGQHSGHDRGLKEPTGHPSGQNAFSPRSHLEPTSESPPVKSPSMGRVDSSNLVKRRLASQKDVTEAKHVTPSLFASPKAFIASKVKEKLSRGQAQAQTTSKDTDSWGQAREELEKMRNQQPKAFGKKASSTPSPKVKARENLIRRKDEIPATISLPMNRSPRRRDKKSTMTEDLVAHRNNNVQTRSSAEAAAISAATPRSITKDTTEFSTMMSEEERDEMRLQQVLAHSSAAFWDADSAPDGPTPKAGNAPNRRTTRGPLGSTVRRNDGREKVAVAAGSDGNHVVNVVDLEHEARLARDVALACALGRANEEDETSSIMQLAQEIQRAAEEELSFHGSVSVDTREQMARDTSFL